MNDLNSIILEGTTKKDQHYNFVDNEQKTLCMFSIATKRAALAENGDKIQEEYLIPCRAIDSNAKAIDRILNKTDNRGIRIVGILKSDVAGVYIFVEHIEYKLGKKSK